MTRDIGLQGLYRGKVNLWVEDQLASSYLKVCWNDDPDVLFLIAGGNEHVAAVVKHAEQSGYENVVGFIDRDFRQSNRADWSNAAKQFRCYVPEVHEVENYLLNYTALAGNITNTGGRTAAEIEARLLKRANELQWWMACRTVIMEFRSEFRESFLEHPKCPQVTDLYSAEQCIVGQAWFQNLAARTAAATAVGQITSRLNAAFVVVASQTANDSWRREYSGKELFRDVRGWLYTKPPRPASPSEHDRDVAKAVAQWQVDHGTVPLEVIELRIAIRQRVGL
jgi:hypothetical protein